MKKISKRGRVGDGRPSIYTLSDLNGVRYVGQTKNPKRREWQHKSFSNNYEKNRAVCSWIISLIEKGELPIFSVIEETNNLDVREVFWIKEFRNKGVKLLNHNEGGKSLSHAIKAKQERPWGYSPVQRRLSDITRTARFFKEKGDLVKAGKFYGYVAEINKRFKARGVRDYVNSVLLKRYG